MAHLASFATVLLALPAQVAGDSSASSSFGQISSIGPEIKHAAQDMKSEIGSLSDLTKGNAKTSQPTTPHATQRDQPAHQGAAEKSNLRGQRGMAENAAEEQAQDMDREMQQEMGMDDNFFGKGTPFKVAHIPAGASVTSYQESDDSETYVKNGQGQEKSTRQVCTNGRCKTTSESHKVTPQEVQNDWIKIASPAEAAWAQSPSLTAWIEAPWSLSFAAIPPTAVNLSIAAMVGVLAGSGLTFALLRLARRTPTAGQEPLLEA
jgi:hypothetical protein